MTVAPKLIKVSTPDGAAAARPIIDGKRRLKVTVFLKHALHQPRHVVGATTWRTAHDQLNRTIGLPALRGRGRTERSK